MTHPRCTESSHRSLTAYLFGDLSPDQRRRVEEHLTCCTTCSRDLEELQLTLDALPAPESTVSACDVQRLQARLSSRLSSPQRWQLPLLTSACALAFFIFYLAAPVVHTPQPPASGEFLSELDILENLEMLQSIDLLEELELLEALESRG